MSDNHMPGVCSSIAWGVGTAAAVGTIVAGVAAMLHASAVSSADGADRLIIGTATSAFIALGSAVVAIAAVRWRTTMRTTMYSVLGVMLTWTGIGLPFVAGALAGRNPLLAAIDVGAAATFAVICGTCGVVTVVCALMLCVPREPSRVRWAVPAGAVALAALLAVTATTVQASRSQVAGGPVEAPSIQIPADVTSIDTVGFRLRQSDRWKFHNAGAGFVVEGEDGTLTAYDGATGHERWTFDAPRGAAVYTARRGETSVVVVVGDPVSMGLDAMTGRVLWRRGHVQDSVWSVDEHPMSGQTVVFVDPTTGVTGAEQSWTCPARVAVNSAYLVRTSCDSPDRIVAVDVETGDTRQIPLSASLGDDLAIDYLGNGLFAVQAATDGSRVPGKRRIAVVDPGKGVEVDSFESAQDVGPASPNGMIVLGSFWSSEPSARTTPDVEFRDTRARRSVRVPFEGSVDLRMEKGAWAGESFVTTRLSGDLVTFDPRAATATHRPSVCTPGATHGGLTVGISSVPGALIVECASDDYLPFGSEIVGLR